MNLPNSITFFRISLIPIFVAVFYLPFSWSHALTAVLFALAGASDWLDGYLARRLGQTSAFGAFLDPVADKLMVAVALVLLVERDPRPSLAIPAAVIIGREIAISGLRGVAAMDGVKVPPSIWGKVKAGFQYLAIFLALLRGLFDEYGGLYPDQWAMILAVVVTVLSAVEYFARFARVLRTAKTSA